MKYLKIFDTEQDYQDNVLNLDTPNDSELAYYLGVDIVTNVVDDGYRNGGVSVRGVLDA